MNDYKTIDTLRKEYANLDNYILSLTEIIAKLEANNIDLTNKVIKLEKEKIQFESCTARVYAPNKSYKELEEKLTLAENSKQAEIDELYETKIIPLREKMQQLEGQLISEEVKRKKDIDELWETRITPLQNQVKDREIKMESMYKQQVSYTEEISHLKKIIDRLNTVVNYAAGYISACKQFSDKHPNYVKDWLFQGVERYQK